jgi:uncharacterized protein (TIGR00661 family)
MRILYGVVGEGMGHATRSRVVIEHLLASGHEVHVLVSGRAHAMLAKHFTGVHRVHGWHLVYEDNVVKKGKTAWSNLVDLLREAPILANAYQQLESFQPEVVISDFESWSYVYAKSHHVPVISVDNMQVINRCEHDEDVLDGHKGEFLLAKGIVKSKLPGADRYIITSFFRPPLRKERTTIVAPILRPEVLAAKPSQGTHVVVYSSADSAETLEEVLKSFPDVDFRVYGMRRGITAPQIDGNLAHQPFSETGFVDDLASARAVIAGGGFSLMGEAVFLHKPMLSVPLEGQFEQILNARYLQKLGFGLCRESVSHADVQELLTRADELAGNLARYQQDGNAEVFAAVDQALVELTA